MAQHAQNGLVFDIWHSILSIPEAFTTTELLDLQFTSRNFLTAIRPLIFRHINLVDEDRGRGFVEAVTSSNFDTTISTKYTRAFQLSFSPSGSDDEITEFWILVGRALESMTSLKSLNLCFAHGDENFAEYLGYLIQQLPTDTVRKLHLLPIPEETVLSTSLGSLSHGPWNHPNWPDVVGSLGPICSLVISTPTHLIWPPHDQRVDQIIARWISRSQNSSLDHISFYFAYLEELEEDTYMPDESEDEEGSETQANGNETYHNHRLRSRRLDVDSDMGVRLYLQKNAGQWTVTPHRQFGDENFTLFTFEGNTIKTPWLLHFDDVGYARDVERMMNTPGYGELGDSRPMLYF